MRSYIILLVYLLAARNGETRESAHLNATLWTQRAPEHGATLRSLFELARQRLDEALRDSAWTATPAEQLPPYAHKPPAVILDLDETVLDNSPFVAWLLLQGRHYDEAATADWDRWVGTARAEALPGALEFIQQARERQVAVFFISNREAAQEEATRRNLAALGVALEADVDEILLKGERPAWRSDKGSRRRLVADSHRVLLMVGDSREDFPDNSREQALTSAGLGDPHAARWGREWIMLPNPMYGLWEEAAGQAGSWPRHEQIRAMREELRPWDGN